MTEHTTQATILVVEDDSTIRHLVQIILKKGGFEVLTASSGAEALSIEASFPRPIDLLLSDVVMPGTTGPELAMILKTRRSNLRVMLMSGYPNGALLLLNYGWHFIAKPFMPEALLRRVRDVLGSAIEEQNTDQFDTRKERAKRSWPPVIDPIQ